MKWVGVKLLIVLSLTVGLFLPFSFSTISANTSLSAPFVGVNVYVIDRVTNSISGTDTFTNVKFTSNNNALRCTTTSNGVCTLYQAYNTQTSGYTTPEVLQGSGSSNISLSLNNQNFYRYEFILDNNYIGYVYINNIQYFVNGNSIEFNSESYTGLFTIGDYDLSVNSLDNWYYPIESYSAINPYFLRNYEQVGINNYNNYSFPIFRLNTGDIIFTTYSGQNNKSVVFVCGVFGVNVTSSNFSNYFDYSGLTLTNFDNLQIIFNANSNGTYGRIIKLTFSIDTLSTYINFTPKRNMSIMPIFLARFPNYDLIYNSLSTDFALNFGFSNSFLDNISIIANGTNNSNSSVNNNNTTNNEFSSSSNELYTYEDNFNNDLNDNLDNISFDTGSIGSFGSKFLLSSEWVGQQFNRLTGATPFGSVLSFSLLLGLALLVVGKLTR